MKQIYESPSVMVLVCDKDDIITTSNEYELPVIPGDTDTELPIAPASVW